MDIVVKKQSKPLRGEIEIPADKSVSHRSLILGSMTKSKILIKNYSVSDDFKSTLEIIKSLGAKISYKNEKELILDAENCFIEPDNILNCGNSGTSMRLLSGLIASLGINATLMGDKSLSKRPMGRIIKPLELMGAKIKSNENKAPLTFYPSKLEGIDYESEIASAQVKSCILLAGLNADGITTFEEPILSRNHTELMLKYLGADIEFNHLKTTVRRSLLTPSDIEIIGDISSAAFFMVLASIVPNSEIIIKNVGLNPTRCGIIKVLNEMGGNIEILDKRIVCMEEVGDIRIKYSDCLKGVEIKGDIIPTLIDEIPIIAVLALFAKGKTKISGAGDLRNKESDRIKAIVSELKKIGADIVECPDGFIIEGQKKLNNNNDVEIDTYNDHRLAMSMFVASIGLEHSFKIKDFHWVNTSFPEFLSLMANIGVEL